MNSDVELDQIADRILEQMLRYNRESQYAKRVNERGEVVPFIPTDEELLLLREKIRKTIDNPKNFAEFLKYASGHRTWTGEGQ